VGNLRGYSKKRRRFVIGQKNQDLIYIIYS